MQRASQASISKSSSALETTFTVILGGYLPEIGIMEELPFQRNWVNHLPLFFREHVESSAEAKWMSVILRIRFHFSMNVCVYSTTLFFIRIGNSNQKLFYSGTQTPYLQVQCRLRSKPNRMRTNGEFYLFLIIFSLTNESRSSINSYLTSKQFKAIVLSIFRILLHMLSSLSTTPTTLMSTSKASLF